MRIAQTIGLVAVMAAFTTGAALAQTTPTNPAAGTTSGPASQTGHSATLGSNGQPAATPHQSTAIQNHGNPNGAASGNGQLGQKPAQQ